jgi:hypothetical protein
MHLQVRNIQECRMGKFIDLTGQRFGRWLVISADVVARRKWLCRCDCGNQKSVAGHTLTGMLSKSCGCARDEETSRRNFKHGVVTGCHRATTPRTYNCWRNMKARCQRPNSPKYPIYGGRGIKVCDRWQDFANFLEDMGECPSAAHSIDRIDNDGNYEPSNCRWATVAQQASNQSTNLRLTLRGQTMTLAEWSRSTGINHTTILQRINRSKWSVERALTEPVHGKQP